MRGKMLDMFGITAEKLGSALKALREERGLSPAQLAKKAKFGQGIVDRTEAGYQFPVSDSLLRWLEALDITPVQFFTLLQPPGRAEGTVDIAVQRRNQKIHEKLEEILEGGGDAALWITGNITVFHSDHVRKRRAR